MPLEQLLVIVFVVAISLVQYLMSVARQRKESSERTVDMPPEQEPEIQQPQALKPLARPLMAMLPTTSPKIFPRLSPVAASLGRCSFDLRRAIVSRTLIGRCRADEPYDWPTSF